MHNDVSSFWNKAVIPYIRNEITVEEFRVAYRGPIVLPPVPRSTAHCEPVGTGGWSLMDSLLYTNGKESRDR